MTGNKVGETHVVGMSQKGYIIEYMMRGIIMNENADKTFVSI